MNDTNYIHIMAFKTELDEENSYQDTAETEPKHIDSIAAYGDWKDSVQRIIDENKTHYHRIFLEDDLGFDLSDFQL